MYVIRDTDDRIYPADRCTYKVGFDTDEGAVGYVLQAGTGNEIWFYPGNAAREEIKHSGSNRAQLGIIGSRTGRFTPITGE